MSNNYNKKNKINYEKEGVFYTPEKSSENSGNFESFEDFGIKKNSVKKTPKKLPPQKSKYPAYMTIAIISGVLAFIILLILMKNILGGENGVKENTDFYLEPTTKDYETYSKEKNSDVSVSGNEYLGVIRSKSDSFKTLTIYNISFEENADYTVTGGTQIFDKYGKGILFDELREGDLVDFVYDKENVLISVNKSDEAFSETLKSGFKFDKVNKTISNGMKTYNYSEMTKFIYKNEDFDPEFIDPSIDTITISGHGDVIWAVTLDKGHGEITVIKNNKIKNGIIEIDTNIYKKLNDIDTVKLNEGVHKIVVKGTNIESFTKEITLAINEKVSLDLNEVPIKAGKVTIRPNVDDYALYINGNLELSREPLELEYGSYTVEIVKYGYITYTSRFTVDSPEKIIKPNLTKEVKMGTLTVNSNPSGANLMINGASVGMTPYSCDLVQGQHSITLKKDGYKDITIDSIYISEQGATYNVELQKE